ncbi:MAG: aminoglycoside phosphotransferase family protein [Sphingomonadaceae bacterium]
MAANMIPPAAAPDFLAENGWEGAEILPLAGDASFRRYFRVHRDGETAVLMDAPPAHEDVGPFLAIAGHLLERGFSPPRPMAIDRDQGLLLLEDFGDERVAPMLERKPKREREIYEMAIDILVELAGHPAPEGLPPYGDGVMRWEVSLFPDWYAPALSIDCDAEAFYAAWEEAWAPVLEEIERVPVLTLRDYHADNLMVLPDRRGLGLLDFQDARAGHPAYDLVSLLQDARRDVAPELEEAMFERYVKGAGVEDEERFRADYLVLGAQRNVKILGIFTRLWQRDGKPHYLHFQPRVWSYLERDLAHPALAPVAAWFDQYVPDAKRAAAWPGGGRP